LKFIGEDFFFSEDLQTWQNFMEFFTGQFGVSVNVAPLIPQITLHAVLDKRT